MNEIEATLGARHAHIKEAALLGHVLFRVVGVIAFDGAAVRQDALFQPYDKDDRKFGLRT